MYLDTEKIDLAMASYDAFLLELQCCRDNIDNYIQELYEKGWSGEAADAFLEFSAASIAAIDENIDRVKFLRSMLPIASDRLIGLADESVGLINNS